MKKMMKKYLAQAYGMALGMDFLNFLVEYLLACHPECVARAMVHYGRVKL